MIATVRTAEGTNRAAITICVMLATIMQALDTTIANIALPYIQGSVSASQDQINWVLTAYLVCRLLLEKKKNNIQRDRSCNWRADLTASGSTRPDVLYAESL